MFSWRYARFLAKGQSDDACGDVVDPRCLLPVMLGTGAGEMDHPSVITISPVTCRMRDWEYFIFSLDGSVVCCGTEHPFIPAEQRHLLL